METSEYILAIDKEIKPVQNFVNKIFKNLICDNNDNFCFSPASYLEAMYSLSLCLNGENLREFLDVLGIEESELIQKISDFKLNIKDFENHNILLYSHKYKDAIQENVLNLLKEIGTDSASYTDNIELISRINKIVCEKTHGKIVDLISKKDVDDLTCLAILNCVYFKKDWLKDFTRQSHDQIFGGSKGNSAVRFLHRKDNYNYYEDNVLDIVEIPYKDSDICCYLFCPTYGYSLFSLTNDWQINYNKINNLKNDIEVSLTVPEFKVESKFSLAESTYLAGIKNIFNWNKDWSLIDFRKLKSEAVMKVQSIIQKTYFDFNIKGTEAAAATCIIGGLSGCLGLSNLPKVKYIVANRPFIYVLANKNNKEIPLFIGQVKNI